MSEGLDRKIYTFFRKHTVDWLKMVGISTVVGAETVDVLTRNSVGDILSCSGLVKPTDATDGYAKGCTFIKTDAAAGSKSIYENTGTKDSCVFNLAGEEVPGDLVLTTNSMLVGVAGYGSALAIATNSLPGRAAADVVDITIAQARVLGRITGGSLGDIQILNEHVDAAAAIHLSKIDGLLTTAGFSITGSTSPALVLTPVAAGAGLKIHTHQMTGATYDYANEFKGECVKTSSLHDGIAADYHLAASGTTILRAVRGSAYLDTGFTMSGALATQSWLAGGVFSANVAGILNGAGVCIVGAYGEISSCSGGTLTAAKYVASLWGNSTRLTTLSSGLSALLLLTNWGIASTDYGIRIENTGTLVTGIGFAGAYTGNVVDFSGITYVPTGSAGPCLIRCGSYNVPLANNVVDQSGLIRLYMQTSADGSSYDRAIFSCLKTTGTKGIITTSGLAEVLTDGTGPANVKGCEFIVDLHETGSNLPASGIAYGGWFKITAIDGATINATARIAPLWLDNQLFGVNSATCLEYTIWSTTGGNQPRAWAGFGTTSSGWKQLFHFDSTMAAVSPFVATGCVMADGGLNVPYLKVLINATQYGIPLIAI